MIRNVSVRFRPMVQVIYPFASRGFTQSRKFHLSIQSHAFEVPNQPPQTKLAETRFRRFWRLVTVEKNESIFESINFLMLDGYVIKLDSKPLRTPIGNIIVVPPRLSILAHLIGLEWDVVTTGSVRQHTLPLTSLVCRAIDHLTPGATNEIRSAVIESVLRYLDTDAILFFAPEYQGHGTLTQMQAEEWNPVINWAQRAFDVKIYLSSGETGIGQFKKQPEETKRKFRQWLQGLDSYELAAFERAVMMTNSFLLSTRLLMEYLEPEKCEGRYGVEGIASLATVEVRWQTQRWGEVEDSIPCCL